MSTRPLLATTAEISADESPAILVRAPAKLNLSLAVLARRDDGFHEIESLIAPVTLHDSLRVRASQRPGIRLHVRFGGRLATPAGAALAHDVPTDASNLVVRAAQALAVEAGGAGWADAACVPRRDVELGNRVPSGSRRGGGAGAGAAGG
ncbi:MAG: hypothetical protein ACKOK8_11550, partial [Planctomycetia bacterium]